jgi:L-serine dehydratase
MAVSVFDLFSIGIGPSSSHTVGPMRAAHRFAGRLKAKAAQVAHIKVELFGSLGCTGIGHGTDRAVMLGLEGDRPESVDPDSVTARVEAIQASKQLRLLSSHPVGIELVFHRNKSLPFHPNGMRCVALDREGAVVESGEFYSVGGGFIVEEGQTQAERQEVKLPYPFTSGDELLQMARDSGLTIPQLMMANEKVWRSEAEIRRGLLRIAEVMHACMERGFRTEGVLPGGLGVVRRAPAMHRNLTQRRAQGLTDPAEIMDWVSLYALSVNEENAAGGRVVTAPTNGAAGIIPAVLRYYLDFTVNPSEEGVITYMLTAGAIGILYKRNASISAAEVGCQGEVGVACSMAAGALAAALGDTNEQIEHAAEIGMEHNLGLTCDPVGGLVQIPCIERNTMGALKAINAQRLARQSHDHCVSLDQVIATMRQTGKDMRSKSRETSRGGLAVNVVEC